MLFIFALILAPFYSFASSLDQDLSFYIEQMNLKALPAPAPKREALYQLGLRLFYDQQLSGKENISCHSCHSLTGFSGDTLPLGLGEGAEGQASMRHQSQGSLIPRHTPPLYNLGLEGIKNYFWDGRVSFHPDGGWLTPEPDLNGRSPKLKEIAQTLDSLLAAQSLFPMANPEEMLGQGSSLTRQEAWESIMARILNGRLGASYRRFFKEAFPQAENFNIGHAANALAELERHHFMANNTLWDLYLQGKKTILTERMKRGAILFLSKGSCTNCHTGDHFSSFGFQNIGIPQIGPGFKNQDDLGRMEVTQADTHKYRFRVSPLRNVGLTAPYMHTGVFKNMWEVIDHYNHPMGSLHHFNWNEDHSAYRERLVLDRRPETISERSKNLAPNLPRNLGLEIEEKKDLYCFLMVALTDIKNQKDLLKKGVLDEIQDCSPRPYL